MISADTLAILMAKGLAGDDLLEVVRAIDTDRETHEAARKKRQERNRRYYEAKKEASEKRLNKTPERLKASEKRLNQLDQRLKTSYSDAKVFPSPPYDINSTPHTPFQNTQSRVREVFEKFWAIYPKRVNRKAALAKLETALKAGINPEKILAGAVRYAEHVRFTEPQFIKAPDAWLNAGKWDDELPAETQKPQARAGPKSSSGNGFSVLLDELRAKRNGQQSSTNEPRDITPARVSEPGAGNPGSRLPDPIGKSSGGGEILDFRSVSPHSRRSPAPFGEAARTFDWDDPVWRFFDSGGAD